MDRVARYHSRKVARRLQGSPACRWWSVRWQGCKSAARSPASNAIFSPLIALKGWGVFTPAERTAKAPTPESPHPTLANFFPKSPPHLETFLGKHPNCCAESVGRKCLLYKLKGRKIPLSLDPEGYFSRNKKFLKKIFKNLLTTV